MSAALLLPVAVCAVLAAIGLPERARGWVTGLLIAVLAAGGAVVGGWVLAGHEMSISTGSGVLAISLSVDALAGLFLLLIGLVAVPASLFGIQYAHGAASSRTAWASLAVFVLSMQLVVAADSALAFLTAWELMALASLLLVLTEQAKDAACRSAGLWYAAMTQFGFLLIAVVLLTLAGRAGSGEFEALHVGATDLSSGARGLLFAAAVVGFCSKAGAVPLHVWLPRAHPAAPSHVSAVMSGAMVSLGVYALLRIGVQILGPVQTWWAVLVLALGALSALYGVLRAVVSTDIKRLLAFSTSENIGLVLIGVGAGLLLLAQERPGLAALAFAAALLHTVNHGVFKTLLFMGAGSVHRATGERDLDDLGGLVNRMPATTALFGIGALAAAALPIGNGFVSEWLLLQSLVNGQQGSSVLTALVMPAAVAVVALTTGLAVATFVKAFGVGFLARPRSQPASLAKESSPVIVASMVIAALFVLVLGLFPVLLIDPLNRATQELVPGVEAPLIRHGFGIQITGTATELSPLLLAVILAGFGAAIAAAVALSGRGRRRNVPAWGCGELRTSPRMQYTATSFAEPLVRVFDGVLSPVHNIDAIAEPDAPMMEARVRFSQRIGDRFEERVYLPTISAVTWWGTTAKRIANGSINRYLAYIFIALLIVVTVAAL